MPVYLSQHMQRKLDWCHAVWHAMCAVCTCSRCVCLCHTLPTEVECSCTSSRKFPSRLQSAMTDYRCGTDFCSLPDYLSILQVQDTPEEQRAHTGFMEQGSFVALIISWTVCFKDKSMYGEIMSMKKTLAMFGINSTCIQFTLIPIYCIYSFSILGLLCLLCSWCIYFPFSAFCLYFASASYCPEWLSTKLKMKKCENVWQRKSTQAVRTSHHWIHITS